MKTYSILSYNRTGSTVVGQVLAAYFEKEYQAEITNIPDLLMRYDSYGKSYTVDYQKPLPKGTFNKTYDVVNGQVVKTLLYDNPKPFVYGSEIFFNEVEKRKNLIRHNSRSASKSIFKIQCHKYLDLFNDLEVLHDYNFLFCTRRDLKEQILSYLVAMETKLFHIGYNDQIVDTKCIDINKDKFNYCVKGLKATRKMFEYFKDRNQIDKIIYYEDWQDDTNKILPLLGLKHKPVETFKKIKYTVGSKHNLVNNLQEVYDWMDNEPEFNYTYRL